MFQYDYWGGTRWNKHLLYKEEGLWIFARNWDYIINRNCREIFSRASILNIMGQLVIAILIGMVWRAAIGVPHDAIAGTNFASKKLLRFGIILLGMRLNLVDIAKAGPKVLVIAAVVITFTIFVVYGLTKVFKVEKLGILTACGTAICGAAAVVAIAPQVKAKMTKQQLGGDHCNFRYNIYAYLYVIISSAWPISIRIWSVLRGDTA